PLANVLPSGEKATATTASVCPVNTSNGADSLSFGTSFKSQRRMVWSSLPEASVCPSEAMASDNTAPAWPVRMRAGGLPPPPGQRDRSQSRIVQSPPPVAKYLPLGLNARQRTCPRWPPNVARSCKSGQGQTIPGNNPAPSGVCPTDQSLTVISLPAVASHLPSKLKANAGMGPLWAWIGGFNS